MGKQIKLKNYSNITERHKRRLIAKETKCDVEKIYRKRNIKVQDQTAPDESHMSTSFNNYNKDSEHFLTLQNDTDIASCSFKNFAHSVKQDINLTNTEIHVSVPSVVPSITSDHSILLKQRLAAWAIGYNINQNAVSSILQIFNEFTTYSLPKDARSLLCTLRQTKVEKLGKGEYAHLGLERAVKNLISLKKRDEEDIDLLINIDGLPISRSSNACLWPILCSDNISKKVFLIGSYYGNEKPTDINLYLQKFVTESIELIENGCIVNNIRYKVNIAALVCDAPAKSLVLGIKGHTGYNSCTKCKIEGQYENNRICFPSEADSILRERKHFEDNEDDDFLFRRSILLNVPNFDPISNVPLDYLHLVCLGVVKKMIVLWLSGRPLSIRIPGITVSEISASMLQCKKTVPKEIARKPWSLSDVHHWKATEFRTFLLYLGPIVLKSKLDKDVYLNFLTLHIAIRILCSAEFVKIDANVEYAESLLTHFVSSFGIIYGIDKISYNVHNLLHLSQDVRKFGSLDEFSAFRFESYMFTLKKLIRKNEKPLQQLMHRYIELENFVQNKDTSQTPLKKLHNSGPLPKEFLNNNMIQQFKIYETDKYLIDCRHLKDSYVMLNNGEIFQIINIICNVENENIHFVGRPFTKVSNLYSLPCESKDLDIYVITESTSLEMFLRNIIEIKYKLWLVPYNLQFVGIPLLHTI